MREFAPLVCTPTGSGGGFRFTKVTLDFLHFSFVIPMEKPSCGMIRSVFCSITFLHSACVYIYSP